MRDSWAIIVATDRASSELHGLQGLADLIEKLRRWGNGRTQIIKRLSIGGNAPRTDLLPADPLRPFFGRDRLDDVTVRQERFQLENLGKLFVPGGAFWISFPEIGENDAVIGGFARALGPHVRVQGGTTSVFGGVGPYREVYNKQITYYLPPRIPVPWRSTPLDPAPRSSFPCPSHASPPNFLRAYVIYNHGRR